MKEGHILVAVNNHIVLNEDFEDVLDFIDILKESRIPRRLRFLNPLQCPIGVYEEKIALRDKSQKDMYGFFRTAEYLRNEKLKCAANIMDTSRRDWEWVIFLKSIGGADNLKPSSIFKPSSELKLMVRRGIPAAFRPLIWKHISLSNKRQILFPCGYYGMLVAKIDNMHPRVFDAINKDLCRTFPDHDYFGGGLGLMSLRRVLCAFAIHRPEISYCQSLNFITANILLFMAEEDAFWLLTTIVECLLPIDWYTKTMIGTYVDQSVFLNLIKLQHPKMYTLIESLDIQLSVVTIQWFMCLFVNTLVPEVALRVWDIFLNEGDKVLFRVAIALLKMYEYQLQEVTEASDMYSLLKEVGKNVFDADVLIRLAYKDHDLFLRDPKKFIDAATGIIVWRRENTVPSTLEGIGLAHREPVAFGIEKGEVENASKDKGEKIYKTRLRFPSDDTSTYVGQFQYNTTNEKNTSFTNSSKLDTMHFRQFYRSDINKLRLLCRPEVEQRFCKMEEARQRYKEQEAQKISTAS